jgi:hypothetical protein
LSPDDPTQSDLLHQVAGVQDKGGPLNFTATLVAPPENDNFGQAWIIDPQAIPYYVEEDSQGATVEGSDPAPSCGYNVGKTVWFKYSPSSSGAFVLHTIDPGFDTVLSVWTYDPGPQQFTELGCNNDDPLTGWSSRLGLSAQAGVDYYIMIGGYQDTGALWLSR